MKLLATSDLHLAHKSNREALERLGEYPDDWIAIVGDVGERPEHLVAALQALVPRFARVIWTPGNHDLWCPPGATDRTRGQARYDELVAICRDFGVLTPEDPYPEWPADPATIIVPMFLLFDYSFRPSEVANAEAVSWARASGVVSTDEQMLDPTPWPSRAAWCHARCDATEARLAALPAVSRTVLINHWPLRYDLALPPRVPRFSIWCGTRRTEDWPRRFRARVVVSGHLHLRTTLWRHGVRYEEVSLGYPRDWRSERGIDWYLREILPATSAHASRFVPPRDPYMRHSHTRDP
ncbi:MAG TPA: metallophosphoesterase [Vicinamibacterales bacterium]|nr:metallophosphoesterase [Vicinamibacterales bacterium]